MSTNRDVVAEWRAKKRHRVLRQTGALLWSTLETAAYRISLGYIFRDLSSSTGLALSLYYIVNLTKNRHTPIAMDASRLTLTLTTSIAYHDTKLSTSHQRPPALHNWHGVKLASLVYPGFGKTRIAKAGTRRATLTLHTRLGITP
ncbi:hypothetical protein CC2G_007084 [Coprinopsis cinerea AmutBmut pab1-1]|nr:hypothetical protein CC2G_007084 [Coprinopsis cinerea AmutBmut pab1-1]